MARSQRFTPSIFSSTLISTARHAHFFASVCGVCSPGASCASWCPTGAYLRAYSGPWDLLVNMRPLECTADGWRDRWGGHVYETKMQLVNAVFRQGYEHKYAYDDENLVLVMREEGFADVVVQQYAISMDSKMAPDTYERRTESLYVEAVKR